MSKNALKLLEEMPYSEKITNTINYLEDDKKNFFKKSLKRYKFDQEVYIPDSMSINKSEYKNKNYLLNRLVKFNKSYQIKKDNLNKIQIENDKFTKQYELVKSKNESAQNAYLNEIQEIYKIKGYDAKTITYNKKENIFNPSILIEENEKFPIICRVSAIPDIKKDISYLGKFEKTLKDRRGKSVEEEGKKKEKLSKQIHSEKNVKFKDERRESTLINDEYAQQMENIKKKIMEELKIKNLTLKQLKVMNLNLQKDIRETEASIKSIDDDYTKKKKYVVEDIFLSSKGMMRSAKKRHLDNKNEDIDKKNILILDDNKIEKKIRKEKENEKDVEKIIYQRKKQQPSLTKILKKEAFQKEKIKKLTKVYSNILKSNFKAEQKDVKNYIRIYSDRKIEEPDPKVGSNLHGFLSDFQQYIKKTNIPYIATEVNDAIRTINKMNKNSNDPKKKSIQITRNVDNLYDLDENITQLGYDYTDNLLYK